MVARCSIRCFAASWGQRKLNACAGELEQVLTAEDALLFIGLCSGCVERIGAHNRDGVWDSQGSGFRLA